MEGTLMSSQKQRYLDIIDEFLRLMKLNKDGFDRNLMFPIRVAMEMRPEFDNTLNHYTFLYKAFPKFCKDYPGFERLEDLKYLLVESQVNYLISFLEKLRKHILEGGNN